MTPENFGPYVRNTEIPTFSSIFTLKLFINLEGYFMSFSFINEATSKCTKGN